MNKKGSHRTRPTRREFTRGVVGAIALAPLASAAVSAQTPAPTPQALPSPSPSPSPGQTPAPPSPLALALAEVAKARFGEYIPADQTQRLQTNMENQVGTTARLRAVKLKNADEPDFVFSA